MPVKGNLLLQVPHWSLVLLFGSLGLLVRPQPRMKFGLRELFIIITLAAAVLAGLEWLVRNSP